MHLLWWQSYKGHQEAGGDGGSNSPRASHSDLVEGCVNTQQSLTATQVQFIQHYLLPGCPAVTPAPGAAHHPSVPRLSSITPSTPSSPRAFASDTLDFELQTIPTTFSIPLAARCANTKCPAGVCRAWEGCIYLSCNNKTRGFHILLRFSLFPTNNDLPKSKNNSFYIK